MKNELKTKRDSGLDLLRILSMLMVVVLHCLFATGVLDSENAITNNYAWLLRAFSIVAVNCFFLITGYFGGSRPFKVKKLVLLWMEVEFYSVSIYIIAGFIGVTKFTMKGILFSLCPIMFKQYWYMTTYFVLELLRPFLNCATNNMSVTRQKTLVGVLIVVFSLCTTFVPVEYTLDDTSGYGIIWAITMYCIGNLKSKSTYQRCNKSLCFSVYATASMLIYISGVLINKYAFLLGKTSAARTKFYQYNSILVLIAACALFDLFRQIDCESRKGIRLISTSTLAVYLIHAHPAIFIPLWTTILKLNECIESNLYIIVSMVACVLVFFVCILIDKFRIFIFHNFLQMKRCEKIFYKIDCQFNEGFNDNTKKKNQC